MSKDLEKLQYLLKHNYMLCASHGKFIERSLKDAAFSGQTEEEEKRRNELSIILSHLLEQTNTLAQTLQVYKEETNTKYHALQGYKLTTTSLHEVGRQTNTQISEQEVKTSVALLSKQNKYKERQQKRWLHKTMTEKKKELSHTKRA